MAAAPVGTYVTWFWGQARQGQSTAHTGISVRLDGVQARLGELQHLLFFWESVVGWTGLGCCTYWQKLGLRVIWAKPGNSTCWQMPRLGVGHFRLGWITRWHKQDLGLGMGLVENSRDSFIGFLLLLVGQLRDRPGWVGLLQLLACMSARKGVA